MKIRVGFVSNSSSSSFVIKDEIDEKQLSNFSYKKYRVSDLIKNLSQMKEYIEYIKKLFDEDKFPDFIFEQFSYLDIEYLDELKELEKAYPNCYITSPIDRDMAYLENVNLEVFESDL